ncbi:MAG: tyrosine-type recombinase/integrase [Desulfobacteraceae bacterium]|nr:tyrosine-type recombinase/integrase [Desulfobacteraceae bacterium]
MSEGQNPFAKIKKRKTTENKIRYVKIEEYRALVNKAKNLWWNALILIAYGSGIRRNEILHLTWADVDFENQQIYINPKKETA